MMKNLILTGALILVMHCNGEVRATELLNRTENFDTVQEMRWGNEKTSRKQW